MSTRLSATDESPANPVALLGGCILLITLLLAFSGSGDEGQAAAPDGKPTIKDLRGRGGGGAGAFIPGAPLPGDLQNGGGIPDGPGMTVIEDVRDTMHRLPTNRNDPELYDPPVRVRKPG